MKLIEMQWLFMRLLPRLIDKAHELGFQCKEGDAYRDPRAFGPIGTSKAYGHPRSGHKQNLAFDLLLFKNGLYLTRTEDYTELGEWWEKQHPLCRWGGRFQDGNHFSLEYGGIK